MATGKPEDDFIHDGVMVTRGGVIESVGPASSIQIPTRAHVIDVHGGMS
jgi:imidazolonepropionase-like amidohydrolase